MRFLLLSVALVSAVCSFGQQPEKNWYKGNLHTHTYWSDGDEFPEMVLDWYKSHGYDFIGLSDHNTMAHGEKWKRITRSKMYEDGFQKYLQKFGREWVTYRTDSGRIEVKLKTFDEYRSKFEDARFLVIPSEEITSRLGEKPIHMNATNLQTILPPQVGETVTEVMQKTIDAVWQQRRETGVPMFPHINHPNFYWAISPEDIIDLKGEQFFEVYNGHPLVHNYGDSLRPGMEQLWDMVNIAYARKGQPLLYGLGTDDSHNYHQFGAAFSNAGRGWVMVRTDSLTAKSLIAAMERGDFYASTGVTIDRLEQSGRDLKINVKPEKGIRYTIEFIGWKPAEQNTSVLKKVNGTEATFTIRDEGFVRIRVTSSKTKFNPFQEGDFEMAWTQPVTFSTSR